MGAERHVKRLPRAGGREPPIRVSGESQPTLSPAAAMVNGRGLARLPSDSTARALRQVALLQLQRQIGNTAVQRHLRPPIQRRPATRARTDEDGEGLCPVCAQQEPLRGPDRGQPGAPVVWRQPAAPAPLAPLPALDTSSGGSAPDEARLDERAAAAAELPGDQAADAPQRLGEAATRQTTGHDAVNDRVASHLPTPTAVSAETEQAAADDAPAARVDPSTDIGTAVPTPTSPGAAATPPTPAGASAAPARREETAAGAEATTATPAAMAGERAAPGAATPSSSATTRDGAGAPPSTPPSGAGAGSEATAAGPAPGPTGAPGDLAGQEAVQQRLQASVKPLLAERDRGGYLDGLAAILATIPGAEGRQLPGARGGASPAAGPGTGAARADRPAAQFDADCQNAPQAYVAPPVNTAALLKAKQAEIDAEYARQQAAARATAATQLERGKQLAAQQRAAAQQEKARKEVEARARASQQQAAALARAAQQQAAALADATGQQGQALTSAASQQASLQESARRTIAELRATGARKVQEITDKVRTGAQTLTTRARQAAHEALERGRQAADAARREAERMRQGARGLLDRALDAVRSGINRLVNRARSLWNGAVNAARNLINRARQAVTNLIDRGRQALRAAAAWLRDKLKAAARWLKEKLLALARWLKEKLLAILRWLKKAIIAILKFLQSVLAAIIMALGLLLMAIVQALLKALIKITDWLGSWAKGVNTWLRDKLKDLQEFRARMTTILKDAFTGDLYGCDDAQKAKLTRCSALAVTLGTSALGTLSTPLSPTVKPTFVSFFKSDADEHVKRARAVLGAAVAGINASPTDMKCEPATSTQCGGVHAYTFWAILVPFVSMHFCADFLKKSDREVALVILHEATHKFGRTNDHAYGAGVSKLSTETALDNADSYEQYVGAVA